MPGASGSAPSPMPRPSQKRSRWGESVAEENLARRTTGETFFTLLGPDRVPLSVGLLRCVFIQLVTV